jgi:hypothetical protein
MAVRRHPAWANQNVMRFINDGLVLPLRLSLYFSLRKTDDAGSQHFCERMPIDYGGASDTENEGRR